MSKLIVEETYNAPITKIWQALTDKAQMKKWYFDLAEFKAEVGFEFSFEGQGRTGKKYKHLCKITEVIPYKKLQYSWTYEHIEGYTLVTFELFEEGEQTRLKLTHSGLDSFPSGNPDFALESFQGGWTVLATIYLQKHVAMETNNFAKAEMMIRQPIEKVFEAFVNPEITSKFWFTKGSQQLVQGASLTWTWEMYSLTVPVTVKELIPNEKITIIWGSGEQTSTAEWQFKSLGTSKTFVEILNFNFKGSGDALVSQIRDSTGGFTIVLAGLKAYLEHGIELNLVGDKFPKELWDN